MMDPKWNHPAYRKVRAAEERDRQRVAGSAVVVDTVALADWWEAERAAGRKADEAARFYRVASRCLVVATGVLVAGVVYLVVTG
jgi:hypothetical protein